MTDMALVRTYGRRLSAGAPITGIIWVADVAMIALGDASVQIVGMAGDTHRIDVHDGAILSACRHPDGVSLISGGDDGKVMRLPLSGSRETLGEFGGKWVDHVAASAASGLIAAAVGRHVQIWAKGSPSHAYPIPSSVGGLAFDGKGRRLAVSHYNGASLFHAVSATSKGQSLKWGGSHLTCTISAAGDYIVTALQETGLHGWQLPAMQDMQMSGYSGKTRSFSWSHKDKWLATSGDDHVVVWPFQGKTGPMGKAPLTIGARPDTRVACVAFHPCQNILAVGYSDGALMLARLEDGEMLSIDEPAAPITALAWSDSGEYLAWGDQDGRIGLFAMDTRA
ncbi:WD40 repeat domain-containing protein [Novosphingobium sp. KACC 22771]|uniref:WD40 repeat domain-containing protein n=1 Tax=Novosphingobium sp. KACC 22771 TaxID=3025670 RepID=UPI0023669A12|nr:WD40 repeat domain-containing protein [Novosphingobium sp. KACC 22771]WDF70911.1 WD40 repeat domain-containing protein [Novosphingobium sp. KACC 22771]